MQVFMLHLGMGCDVFFLAFDDVSVDMCIVPACYIVFHLLYTFGGSMFSNTMIFAHDTRRLRRTPTLPVSTRCAPVWAHVGRVSTSRDEWFRSPHLLCLLFLCMTICSIFQPAVQTVDGNAGHPLSWTGSDVNIGAGAHRGSQVRSMPACRRLPRNHHSPLVSLIRTRT